MGSADRMVRIIVGLIALGAGYYLGMNYWVMGIGAIILITGLVNLCPVYLMLGMSTASKKEGVTSEAPRVPEVPSMPQAEESKEEEPMTEEPKEEAPAEEPAMEEEAPKEEETMTEEQKEEAPAEGGEEEKPARNA